MNIFLYEWKKVWKNGAVLKVVLLFLMLSAAIFWADAAMDSEIRTATSTTIKLWIPFLQMRLLTC